jgi:transposase-like protein
LANWIKQYSEVKIDDNTVLTAKQIKELQKRNAQLEEENLILKKPLRYSRDFFPSCVNL